MTPPAESHDPGLQQERTVLAWDRTALAILVVSGLLMRSLGEPLLRHVAVVPAGGVVLGLAVLILDRPRYVRRWRGLERGEGMAAAGAAVVVAVGTVVLGLTALAVVVARPA